MAGLELEEEDFQWVTNALLAMAGSHASGRIVSTLEGGYDLDALSGSVERHVSSLASA